MWDFKGESLGVTDCVHQLNPKRMRSVGSTPKAEKSKYLTADKMRNQKIEGLSTKDVLKAFNSFGVN